VTKRRSRRPPAIVFWGLVITLALPAAARAQALEPRLFSNAPVGLNFILLGYSHSTGNVVLDASIPLQDAELGIHAAVIGYARSLAVGGRSAQIQVVAPYAWLSGRAVLSSTGETATRNVDGFGDPAVRFAVNLHGAPALTAAEFAGYRQDLVVGVSLLLVVPIGQYDPSRLVNLGTNRWTFRPEFGFAKAIGHWILEGIGSVNFYTDNDNFYGGQHRSQAPIYSLQGHAIYNWRPGLWLALDANYYTGGRTTIDGVEGNDLQNNSRVGATLALPLDRRHSIKFYASQGVSTRTGDDFRVLGAAWQYRWGS